MKEINKAFFDEIHDRRIQGDIKYEPVDGVKDLIPMWIADMDFKCPPAIGQAIKKAADRELFGYMAPDDRYYKAVTDWYERRFGWHIEKEEILPMPGVVFAVACVIKALTEPGDKVLICEPVYYPFRMMIEENGRQTEVSELVIKDGRYEMDFEDLEKKISRDQVKLFILCSPHNPVSRVWTKDELSKISEICLKHGVPVISDEIHSDLIYSGIKHTPFALISEEMAENTVTCTAPTKTFNMAGIQASNVIIKNRDIRNKVRKALEATGYFEPNYMGITALTAAYEYGEEWLEELIRYLEGNIRIVREKLRETGGKIRLTEPEGTYLLWLDCRGMNMDDKELDDFFLYKTGIRFDAGTMFGSGGNGFTRMNIACPESVLTEALDRIINAID